MNLEVWEYTILIDFHKIMYLTLVLLKHDSYCVIF